MKPKQKEDLENLLWSLWIPGFFIGIACIVYEIVMIRFG